VSFEINVTTFSKILVSYLSIFYALLYGSCTLTLEALMLHLVQQEYEITISWALR